MKIPKILRLKFWGHYKGLGSVQHSILRLCYFNKYYKFQCWYHIFEIVVQNYLIPIQKSYTLYQKKLPYIYSEVFGKWASFVQVFSVQCNPLIVNPKKWSNTLKQFVGNLPTNYLGACDHSVGLVLKGFKRL